MSLNPIIDLPLSESQSSVVHNETSNPCDIISQPVPSLSNKPSSTSNSDSYETVSSPNSDDDDHGLPMDLTFDWLDEQMRAGVDLRPLLSRILPGLPEDVSQSMIYEILMDLFLPIRRRKALEQYQTLDDAVELIRTSKNILVLTGAGISVSCGIPDFRSRNGVYARLRDDFPDLPNPQSMFDIEYFTQDPRPFYRFAKEIWPGQYQPSLAHRFIAFLERQDKLLRNYTQNIDSLEHLCPITRLIQCHGSFSSATCRVCRSSVQSDEIKDEILQQKIPHCRKCPVDNETAILKPDIVFFGEQLPDDFHQAISIDKDKCDLLIVMGSSLKVKPVSLVSELLPSHVPQILINRERLPHKTFDIELLGNSDVIINELCLRLKKLDPTFEQLKLLNENHLNEISSEFLRAPTEEPPRKRQKTSDDNEPSTTDADATVVTASSSSSPKPIIPPSFDQDSTYITYPPRRYIFPGAELDLSSSEDEDSNSSSSDDEDDDDRGEDEGERHEEEEEELPRKNIE